MATNRVIKFRAWSEKEKEMTVIDTLYWFEENGVHDGHGRGVNQDFMLMQFTGLHDKNGVEVYEGDIVRIEDGYADESTVHTVEYGVGYGYPAFEFSPQLECECNGFSYVMQGGEATIEVIGNVYEHPHLLENTND